MSKLTLFFLLAVFILGSPVVVRAAGEAGTAAAEADSEMAAFSQESEDGDQSVDAEEAVPGDSDLMTDEVTDDQLDSSEESAESEKGESK